MSNLENKIIKCLKEVLFSAPSVKKNTQEWDETYLLIIKSIKCVRKNEFSSDEIKIHMFWLSYDGNISGLIDTGHDFKEEGEILDLAVNIQVEANNNDIFCILIYEEDNPAFFDPHDLIGLVVFNPDMTILILGGDNVNEKPTRYKLKKNKEKEIMLEAGPDGCYRINAMLADSINL